MTILLMIIHERSLTIEIVTILAGHNLMQLRLVLLLETFGYDLVALVTLIGHFSARRLMKPKLRGLNRLFAVRARLVLGDWSSVGGC